MKVGDIICSAICLNDTVKSAENSENCDGCNSVLLCADLVKYMAIENKQAARSPFKLVDKIGVICTAKDCEYNVEHKDWLYPNICAGDPIDIDSRGRCMDYTQKERVR